MAEPPRIPNDAPANNVTYDPADIVVRDTVAAHGDATTPDMAPPFAPPSHAGDIGTLGPYRVLKELGRGGMGAVYVGFDERLRREVALKVILPKYAAIASAKNRFLREARAAAAIAHDHIVTIYETDERDGVPYLAMQLLPGLSLESRLKHQDPLSLADAVRIGRETAQGLAAAHRVGLVHRDIKPGNLWLEAPTGRVKVLDFGLAKPTEAEAADFERTATGVILGTPSYIAPEQALAQKVDSRADLFSLGALLYRLCSGRLPFSGDTVTAVLAAVLTDDPLPVRSLNPDIPQPLADLIHRLLAKKPADRPGSTEEVVETLRRIEPRVGVSLPVRDIPDDAPLTAIYAPAAPAADDVASRASEVPAPRAERRHPRWRPLVAFGLLLTATIALALVVVTISTPKGTLVIESNDPDVEITVRKDGAVIVDKSKDREIALTVGDYGIEMSEKDGLKLNTDKFTITRRGRETVKVSLTPKEVVRVPVAPKPATPAVAGEGRFRELLSGTAEELKGWAAGLPEGMRPNFVSARVGSNPIRYDAVAVPLPGEWHLRTATEARRDADITQEIAARTTRYRYTSARLNGVRYFADVWVPNRSGIAWFWANPEDGTAEFLKFVHKDPDRPRPCTLIGVGADQPTCETLLWACGPPGPAWEAKSGLTAADLAKAATEARAKGWRPELLGLYSESLPARFRAVFCENRPEYEWELTTKVAQADFGQQISDRRTGGFFPKCICSTEQNGRVEYTALWLKEPAAFHPSPAGRDALRQALDMGASEFLDSYDDRFCIPPTGPLPAGPVRLAGLHFVDAKGLTDATAGRLKFLPPGCENLWLTNSGIGDAGVSRLASFSGLAGLKLLHLNGLTITDAALESVGRFQGLRELQMTNTPLTGLGLRHLKGSKELTFLNLDDCPNLSEEGFAELGELISLKRLWIFRSTADDARVNRLGKLTNLEDLSLMGPRITDACVTTLLKFRNLNKLVLGGVGITDAGFARLKDLPALQELQLDARFGMTAKGVAAFRHFPSLKTLKLTNGGDNITDTIVAGLADCKQLERLDLFGSKVTVAAVQKLSEQLPKCRIEMDGKAFEAKP